MTNIRITEKEKRLLDLLCNDFTYEEMTKVLFRSVTGIKGAVNELKTKTGCKTTRRLVAWYTERKINEQRLGSDYKKAG